jgi:UDP-N-acetylmuramoyl-tripeptide--D-alanyl-D-alanine ligase
MATVEAVARENGAAIDALAADGTAVFPAADAHAGVWQQRAGRRRCLRVALAGDNAPQAEVRGEATWLGDAWQLALHTPAGDAVFTLRVAGRHNVRNALAAAAAAVGAGVPLSAIAAGLSAFTAVKGRSQLKTWQRDGIALPLVDDTYNANPDSVRAAIDVLAELPAPRWLVLGDMGEVGDQGPAFHREVGAYAAARGIGALWCAGALCVDAAAAFGPQARHFADAKAMVDALGEAPACAAALVKGSRFMAMEQVVDALMRGGGAPADTGGPHAA